MKALRYLAFVAIMAIPLAAYAADTDRAKTALMTLLADNSSGNISPQDLRDVVESGSVYASIYVTGGSTATTGINGTPAKVTSFTTAGPANNAVADIGNDEIDLPAYAATYLVTMSMSFSGTANATFNVQVYEDTTAIPQCKFQRKMGSGGDVGSAAVSCLFTASGGEALSVYVSSDGTNDSGTLVEASLNVNRVDI